MGKITRRGSLALAAAIATTLSMAPSALAATDPANPPTPANGSLIERVAGQTRVDTAIAASRAMQQHGNTVILTRTDEWADALASSPLADQINAPILITEPTSLNPAVVRELQRLAQDTTPVTNVIILGGPNAVSPAVEQAVREITIGTADDPETPFEDGVTRIEGGSRYETAVNISAEVLAAKAGTNATLVSNYTGARNDLAEARAAVGAVAPAERALETARAGYVSALGDVATARASLAQINRQIAEIREGIVTVDLTFPTTPITVGEGTDAITVPDTTLGLTVPADGWTWESYLEALEDLYAQGEGQYNAASAAIQNVIGELDYLSAANMVDEEDPTVADYLALATDPEDARFVAANLPESQFTAQQITDAITAIEAVAGAQDEETTPSAYAAAAVTALTGAPRTALDDLYREFRTAEGYYLDLVAEEGENDELLGQLDEIEPQRVAAEEALAGAVDALFGEDYATAEAATAALAIDPDTGVYYEPAGVDTGAFGEFQIALSEYTYAMETGLALEARIPEFQEALAEARDALIAGTDAEVFLTTGTVFADALSAGAAAGENDGVILLTQGNVFDRDGYSEAYLELSQSDVNAVGGPAAAAAGELADDEFVGGNRFETATMVAAEFFDGDEPVALTNGYNFPDAVVAGGFIANTDGPLLLTLTGSLPQETEQHLRFNGVGGVYVFGGPLAVSTDVVRAVEEALEY